VTKETLCETIIICRTIHATVVSKIIASLAAEVKIYRFVVKITDISKMLEQ